MDINDIILKLLELDVLIVEKEYKDSVYHLLYKSYNIRITEHNIFLNGERLQPNNTIFETVKNHYYKKRSLRKLMITIEKDIRKRKLIKINNVKKT